MKILDLLSESMRTERITRHRVATELRSLYDDRREIKRELNDARITGDDEEEIALLVHQLADVDEQIQQLEGVDLTEAKNHMGDREYQTYSGWRTACKKAYPGCAFRGDKDIGAAVVGAKGVGEWDGAVGSVYTPTLKESDSIDHREMLRGLQKALDKAQSEFAEMEDDLRTMKNSARTEEEHATADDYRDMVEKKHALVERLTKRVKLRKAALGGK